MPDDDPREAIPARSSSDDRALAIFHFSLAALAISLLLAFFFLHGGQFIGFLVALWRGPREFDMP